MTHTMADRPSDDPRRPDKRPVGRPRLKIDPDQVAEVAIRLYDEHGFDAVSIEAVAEGLGVSRATLYRTVRTLDELHGILLERTLSSVESQARGILDDHDESIVALIELIRFQVTASVRMRNYIGLYFGWGLSPDVYETWRSWAGDYERLWTGAVENAVEDGHLESDNIKVTTRLVLGMVNWVSRWYSSSSNLKPEAIADAAIKLVLPDWPDGKPHLSVAGKARTGRPLGDDEH